MDPGAEDPDASDDAELGDREHIADRLEDEVAWLVHLQTRDFPPAASLRPAGNWPAACNVVIRVPRGPGRHRLASWVLGRK